MLDYHKMQLDLINAAHQIKNALISYEMDIVDCNLIPIYGNLFNFNYRLESTEEYNLIKIPCDVISEVINSNMDAFHIWYNKINADKKIKSEISRSIHAINSLKSHFSDEEIIKSLSMTPLSRNKYFESLLSKKYGVK